MNEGSNTAVGVAGQAVGVAHDVETNLGVVGVLVLVIIGMAFGWYLTARGAKQVTMTASTELGQWAPHIASIARRVRTIEVTSQQTLTKVDGIDEKLSDQAPRSRRGDR